MIYLFWGILNIAILIFFIFTCFRATKLLRDQYGLIASIVFIFGLFSLLSVLSYRNNNHLPVGNQDKAWTLNEDSVVTSTTLLRTNLEETLISNYQLEIVYGKSKHSNRYLPLKTFSSMTGFTSGTNWEPVIIKVDTTADDKKFKYTVFGVVQWNLLGTTVFTQHKTYNGFASIK